MSNIGQIAGGVAGGVIGFFAGGPVGAIQGFALGFAIASAVFPPDIPEEATPEDPFKVTTATEGTPVPVVFGRRRVPGNVIWFDYENIDVDERTPDGKGKGMGKGGDTEYGTFVFAPLTIGICLGRLATLHGVFNQKNEDWEEVNADEGGTALQFSTPGSLNDFGYGPTEPTTGQVKSSPMEGMTVAHSPYLFVGKNTRNMTPLQFDVEIAVSAEATSFCGDSLDNMPEGTVNPANIYYEILTGKQWALGMDESTWLDQPSFQAAWQVFRTEGLGLAPMWDRIITGKRMLEDLNFHTRSIVRRATNGKLEIFPIRNRNADWALPEIDCADENVSGRSWKKLPNTFTVTFPSKDTDVPFTQRTINLKNEAARDISGRNTPKTYNFPHITDRDLALRTLELQKRHDSYPLILMSVRVPKSYHGIRIGDVVSVSHTGYDFESFDMRVVEVKDDEFSGMGVRLRLLQEIPTLDGQVGPPIPAPPQPLPPQLDPWPTKGVLHTQQHWRSRISGDEYKPESYPPINAVARHEDNGGPIEGSDDPSGFFGYELITAHAEGCGTDVGFGFGIRENTLANLPANLQATTMVIGRAHLFTLDDGILEGDWRCALDSAEHGISMTKVAYGTSDVFNLPDQDGVNSDGVMALEQSPYFMVIGNYEWARWGRVVSLGNHQYRFEVVMRGANKVRLLPWPAGTRVFVFKLRRPDRPSGLIDPLDYGHRPRFISSSEYSSGRRLRMYTQTINYGGRVQSVPEQTVDTFEDLSGAPAVQSAIVQPLEVLKGNMAPCPAAQMIVIGNSRDEDRAWYPLTVAGAGNMEIQIQPFPNDWDGVGDRVVSDSPLIEPFGEEPYLPTDLASYDDYNTDVDGGRSYGKTYRLRVWADRQAFLDQSTPVLTSVLTTVQGAPWPHFSVLEVDLTAAGGSKESSAFFVDVLTDTVAGYYCPPQAVSKIGVWDSGLLGTMGGGRPPGGEFPDDTTETP